MHATVPIALFGWIVVAVGLFLTLRPHRAVIASVIGGYLFLPKAPWIIASGIPPWTCDAAIAWCTFACALAFAPKEILRYRPNWLDAFVALGCVGWGVSSILAGYGIKQAVLDWWFYANWAVIPYFLGRCYLNTPDRLRDLAVGILIALLIYTPLILFEARFYPQLNRLLYGFQVDHGKHIARLDGYRPIVFMVRGLALGIWIAVSTVIVWSLYLSGRPKTWMNIPLSLIAIGSLAVGLLTRSTGAIGLMCAGILSLVAIRMTGWRFVALAMPVAITLYILTGLVGSSLPVRDIGVALLEPIVPAKQLGSLTFRLDHEALLADRARQQPLFGFGGWGDYRDIDSAFVREETGFKRIVTDGFWIITFGQRGLAGVVTSFGWMLVPAAVAVVRLGRIRTAYPFNMLVMGLALGSFMFSADLLLNGFVQPIQGVLAGALASCAVALRPRQGLRSNSSADHRRPVRGGEPPAMRSAGPVPSKVLV